MAADDDDDGLPADPRMRKRSRTTNDDGPAVDRTAPGRRRDGEAAGGAGDGAGPPRLPSNGEEDDLIPRFSYEIADRIVASSSHIQLDGILVSCTFRREKSASIEASGLIRTALRNCRGDDAGEGTPSLSLIKLSSLGRAFVVLPTHKSDPASPSAVPAHPLIDVFRALLGVASGGTKPLKHCERFFPAMVLANAENLAAALASILPPRSDADAPPLTFAIGGKVASQHVPTLASAFEKHYRGARVDLKDPDYAVLAERVQVKGRDDVLALCVLPRDLIEVRSSGIYPRKPNAKPK